MITARRAAWIVPITSACFHPVYDRPTCGPAGVCPPGLSCNAQSNLCESSVPLDGGNGEPLVDAPADAAIPDTPGPPADAGLCHGVGIVQVCFTALPSTDLNLPAGGPFDTSGAGCMLVVGQQAGPALCVLAGANVTVVGNLVAIGARPLVLVAIDTLTVTASGTIDVSSTSGSGARRGAGGNAAECSRSGAGADDAGGAGGGAGGSFGTVGGQGGTGDTNSDPPGGGVGEGGVPGNAQPNPTVLHGGCIGGAGGDGDNGPRIAGGPGGDGGGAVYLIARNRIAIDGNVFASGAGGRVTPGNDGRQEGAGGGGSGGMIVLDAPTIQVSGRVVANGGAGGGGGGAVGGTPGGNGTTLQWNQRAAAGIGDPAPLPGPAGDGAQGTAAGATTNLDGGSSALGAGGGAGGLGVVWIYGALNGGAQMSPAPVQR